MSLFPSPPLGKLLAIISFKKFYASFSLVPFGSFCNANIGLLSVIFFFCFFCCSDWMHSAALSLLVLSSASSLSLSTVLFRSVVLSLALICVVLSYIFCLLVEILIWFMHCSPDFDEHLYGH